MKLSKNANGMILKKDGLEIAIATDGKRSEFWMSGKAKDILNKLRGNENDAR